MRAWRLVPLLAALGAGAPGRAEGDPLASGLFESVLSPAAREHFEHAERLAAAGDWRRAAAAYELVLAADPTFAPAVLGLGRAREAMGDRAGAARAYGRLPDDADAVEALARLVQDEDPERAVGLVRRLTTLRLGDPEPHRWLARLLAERDPAAAAEELDTYLDLAALDGREPDGETMLAVAVGLRRAGHEDEAVALLERILAVVPEDRAAVRDEARGRLDRIAVERAARAMAVGGAQALGPADRAAVEAARREAARGDLDDAVDALRAVVARAPRSAEARAALGDLLDRTGDVAGAERAYALAAALEPDEPAWHARLGLLLARRYGGRRHREAAEELERALALRPGWVELRLRLAEVRREMGRFDEALDAFRAVLDAEPDGPFAEEARERIAELTREPPEPPELPPTATAPEGVPAAAVEGYRVARVYLDRGEVDRAREELAAVLAAAPDWTAAVNMHAAILLREGRADEAARTWERSLSLEPGQPQVRLALGELRRGEGRLDEARRLFAEAARGGAVDAWYELAVLDWEAGRWRAARRDLDAYFAASTGGLSRDPALRLAALVDRRLRAVRIGAGAGLGGLALGLLAWAWRRRTGATLADLAERAPEASRDLARLLSAIRHEVLKHNTTLLDEVAHALDHGDQHAVAFAAVRLYGEPGESGIIDRFEADLAAIARLGRRHGLRLDLKRRDPDLAPMWRAMRRLRRLEGDLRRPWRAGPATSAELRALSVILNDRGYRALGRWVRELGTTRLDAARIAAVDARVRAEPGLAGLALPPLDLDLPGPVPVRALAGDLDDILANLLRNAWTAPRPGGAAPRVGVAVREELDPITGLEHVAIRVRDDAPGRLTTEMIHERGIGRGLGLVAELVGRHEGSISVEAEAPPWAKAVVVRLGRAEPGEDDGEEART